MPSFEEARESIRKKIVILDDIIHILAAFVLLAVAVILLFSAFKNFVDISTSSLLAAINDVLLVLIVMELLWTVLRYLRRLPFSLGPFLFIGVISGTRRIITLEAEMTLNKAADHMQLLIDLVATTLIVFILIVAFYLYEKTKTFKGAFKEEE